MSISDGGWWRESPLIVEVTVLSIDENPLSTTSAIPKQMLMG